MNELSHPGAGRRRGEEGSAYLFVLMALLVLTVLGLSLAVITQTEVQIGGAERSANRVLYGADAGMRVQLAGSFFADYEERRGDRAIRLDSTTVPGAILDETVETSTFYPINASPCNVCTVNTGEKRYWVIDHAVSSLAQRVARGDGTVQASKLVAQMFAIQPKERQIEPLQLSQTDDRRSRIKY